MLQQQQKVFSVRKQSREEFAISQVFSFSPKALEVPNSHLFNRKTMKKVRLPKKLK
jgi:hypothetical protein